VRHAPRVLRALLAAVVALGLAACGGGGSGDTSSGAGSPAASGPDTLHVLVGSELKDLEPYLDQIHQKSGVRLVFEYSGTLAGIDRIEHGEPFDGAWFANDRYFVLGDTQHRIKAQERIMLSPVVIGVKRSVASKLGWTHGVSWKQIAERAGDGSFRFAMTNPTSSNSGFSAAIAVASALAGTPDALRAKDVDSRKLDALYRGQKLTAGSSGWLLDAYVHDQDRLDGVVNYESSLLALGKSGRLHEPLTLLYPSEGIVTADYPLILLDDAKRPLYDKLVAYLKGDEFQRLVMEKTDRRPVSPQVKLASEFPTQTVNEIAFPSSLATVDAILGRYLNQNRVPPHSFYVLDTSGSMEGDRLDGVKGALGVLAGSDDSLTGRFARFENREHITLISFSDSVTPPVDLTMHSATDAATLGAVKTYAGNLSAGGQTAIYSALEEAIRDAVRARTNESPHYDSIVLMTDGENNQGVDQAGFERYYDALPAADRLKIFPILFGEGDKRQLESLATLTGGRVFDAKTQALTDVFKEIRGYQ